MTRQRQRKCLGCGMLFRPDPRNVRHQRYCCQAACRQASKAASQRRGFPNLRTRTTFAARRTSCECSAGVASIRGTGGIQAHQRPVRYKMTAARKPLKEKRNLHS